MTLRSARVAPGGLSETALASSLEGLGYRTRALRVSTAEVTWYDTHDGALGRAGCSLALNAGSGTWTLGLDDGTLLSEPGGARPPEGPGPIGLQLSARLRRSPRCPCLRASLEQSRWTVESLTAAPFEIALQSWNYSPPFADDPRVQSLLLGIGTTSGDPAAADYLMALLEKRLGLVAAAEDPGIRGARLLALSPPGGPPPPSTVPTASDTVAEAAVRVLRAQAWKMKANREGAILDIDPEYVHDLRVATRRARFALNLFVDAFGQPLSDELRGELAWVARTLGPLRDVDVLGERLPALLARVEADAADAAALGRLLAARRDEVRRGVVECLSSDRCERLVHALSSVEPHTDVVPPLSVASFAHRRVARALTRIRAHVGSRAEVLVPAELHVLRILFKRLRYTCEFFASVCELAELIEASTAFQDQLGRYQDAVTAMDFVASLPRRGPSLVPGALIQVYREARERARAKFLRLWKMRGEQLVRWRVPGGG